jgi:hypothetical protein
VATYGGDSYQSKLFSVCIKLVFASKYMEYLQWNIQHQVSIHLNLAAMTFALHRDINHFLKTNIISKTGMGEMQLQFNFGALC